MDVAEFEAAGLYDPRAPAAADRLALLRWLASRGITIAQMVHAARERGLTLTGLAGDLALRPGRRMTLAELFFEEEVRNADGLGEAKQRLQEPAILEEQRQDSPASAARETRRRWPHMSEEAEERLRDGGSPQSSDRDLKRKSREAR